jgi:cytochrome b
MEASTEERATLYWDPLVRITHWVIAATILLNGLVTEEGSQIHVWVGYTAFSLLALRLVWGGFGPEEARFSAFPPNLAKAKQHVSDLFAGRHKAHKSHNPLGALMVYALWGALLVVTVSGIAMHGSPFAPVKDHAELAAPSVVMASYSHDGEEYEEEYGEEGEEDGENEILEEVHEAAATLLFILAGLHIGGVAVESWASRRNLVRSMTVGAKRSQNT